MKKPFSVLMVFLLLLGLMPAAAFAQEAGEEPLTRAAFFQLAVDELGLQYDESMAIELTDVPPGHPNYQAIAIAYHFGWVHGTSSDTFSPDEIRWWRQRRWGNYNGKLLGMSYLYANPKIGQTVTLGTRVQNSGQVSKVKAMVLPNLANPVPLANTAERT